MPWLPSLAIVAILLISLGGIGLGWVWRSTPPTDIQPITEPVLLKPAAVSAVTSLDATYVSPQLPPGHVLSSGAPGIVTKVHIEPGSTVEMGEPVYEVDGIPIVALPGAVLYRDLSLGMTGEDVKGLKRLLRALGYATGGAEEKILDEEALAAALQYRDATGWQGATDVFPHQLVTYLSTAPLEVKDVAIIPGQEALSSGQIAATGAPELQTGSITPLGGSGASESGPKSWEIFVEGKLVGEVSDLKAVPQEIGQAIVAAVVNGSGDDTQQAGIPVRIQGTEQASQYSVPSSAVIGSSDGHCVWVWDGSQYAARDVVVSGGGLGQTFLTSGLTGNEVLTNPVAVLAEWSCP